MSEEQVVAQPQETPAAESQPTPPTVVESTAPESREAPDAWYNSISEEVRNIEGGLNVLAKYKSMDELFTGHVNAQKMIGAKAEGTIKLPGEESTEEEIDSFYDKLGRPKTSTEYEWQPPEDFAVDQEKLNLRNKQFHKAGLTKKQQAAVMDIYKEEVTQATENWNKGQEEKAKATEAQLRHEWGSDYDTKLAAAKQVSDKYGLTETITHYGLDSEKGGIDLLYQLSSMTSEDTVQGTVTPLNRAQELQDLKNHPAYRDKGHPDHITILKRALQLRG